MKVASDWIRNLGPEEPMSHTNFRVAYLCHAEIKPSDWMLQVM